VVLQKISWDLFRKLMDDCMDFRMFWTLRSSDDGLEAGSNWSPWNCGMCCAYGLLYLTWRREENHRHPPTGQPLALSIFEAASLE